MQEPASPAAGRPARPRARRRRKARETTPERVGLAGEGKARRSGLVQEGKDRVSLVREGRAAPAARLRGTGETGETPPPLGGTADGPARRGGASQVNNVNDARQMAAQFARAPHQGRLATPAPGAPNAALLIDFDNVTMGIRSDLSKELKKLLNSDIIKGKVAVQRAYADWRRYPQYIVPLSEASVDLIFAPAYGSSKKNATDIRLAIDALELVFTRPEIGVFILLSGDSDFSSLVL